MAVTLRFPYRYQPPLPAQAAAGAQGLWRPLIPVRLIGPTKRSRLYSRAVLDTGSDHAVFPLDVATWIGAPLPATTRHLLRWRGQSFPLQFADVELELTDGGSTLRWPVTVGFSAAPIRYPILGHGGCLRFFDTTFLGEQRLIELEANPLFPGSTIP